MEWRVRAGEEERMVMSVTGQESALHTGPTSSDSWEQTSVLQIRSLFYWTYNQMTDDRVTEVAWPEVAVDSTPGLSVVRVRELPPVLCRVEWSEGVVETWSNSSGIMFLTKLQPFGLTDPLSSSCASVIAMSTRRRRRAKPCLDIVYQRLTDCLTEIPLYQESNVR